MSAKTAKIVYLPYGCDVYLSEKEADKIAKQINETNVFVVDCDINSKNVRFGGVYNLAFSSSEITSVIKGILEENGYTLKQ